MAEPLFRHPPFFEALRSAPMNTEIHAMKKLEPLNTILPTSVLAVGLLLPVLASAGPGAELQPAPAPILGGELVAECGWPTVVATVIDEDVGSWGSGVLVHPRVVLYSAHSGTSFEHIYFGADTEAHGRRVGVSRCVAHPNWSGNIGAGVDIAYCLLDEAVDEIPATPIFPDCPPAVDVAEGGSLIQVGFGVSQPGSSPDGKKRSLATGSFVDASGPEFQVSNFSGDTAIGDSGGPLLQQLSDGSWRVLGVLSWGDEQGSRYAPVAPNLDWLSTELAPEGIDLTPCHDAQGEWEPGPDCGAFALAPADGLGSWANGCDFGEVTDASELCGPSGGDDSGGETGTTGETGETGTTGETSGDTDGTADAESSGSEGSTGGGSDSGTGDSGTSSATESESSGDANEAGDASGCSCREGGRGLPPSGWLFGLALWGLRGRRRG